MAEFLCQPNRSRIKQIGLHTYEDALLDSNLPPGTEIWKYLDLGKLLALLEEQKSYFSRLDQFDDEYEGSPTAPMVSVCFETS